MSVVGRHHGMSLRDGADLPLSWLILLLSGSWLEGGLCVMWRAQGIISHNGAALLVRVARRAHDKRGWERFGSPRLGS